MLTVLLCLLLGVMCSCLFLLQVTAEWKKANGLIKPGPRTNQVWASLYAEIEQVGGGTIFNTCIAA